MFENQTKVGQDKTAESGIGGMLHHAVDFCNKETNAAFKAASNVGKTALHDLQIVGHAAIDATVPIATGTFVAQEAVWATKQAVPFLKKHPFVKDLLIDTAASAVAGCAVVATSVTGPAAVVVGAEAGAVTYAALHQLMGDKVTPWGLLNGAIDGATGGLGGMLEKAAAKQLAKTGLQALAERTLAKAGVEGLEKHVANIVIKGAHEGAAELEGVIKVGSKTLHVDQLVRRGTDYARDQLYQNLTQNGLNTAAKALRDQPLLKQLDHVAEKGFNGVVKVLREQPVFKPVDDLLRH